MNQDSTRLMQVAEVRRCLLVVRTLWANHDPENPINLMALMPNGMSLHSFCFAFVLTHHNKRMQRVRHNQTDCNYDDDD